MEMSDTCSIYKGDSPPALIPISSVAASGLVVRIPKLEAAIAAAEVVFPILAFRITFRKLWFYDESYTSSSRATSTSLMPT